MADEERNESTPQKPAGEARKSPPPLTSLLIWAFILICIPLALIFGRNPDEAKELKQSEFELALKEGRVKNVVIRTDLSSGNRQAVGELVDSGKSAPRKFVCEVTYSERLDKLINQYCPDYATKHVSNFLSQLLITILPVLLIVALLYFFFSRLNRNMGRGAIQFGKSRARLSQNLDKVTFNDVAGCQEAKEEVEEIVQYLRDPERFHRLGGRIPRGVLMVGPPGTGKTLLARAIAGEADVPFYSISGSDFVEMFVGVGASRVRDMFEQGKKNSPCIIFIDEIDAVGRSRFSGIGGSHDEREQTLNALLVEMDGFQPKSGVIVMAATNRPDVLDPALLRPGRFDRQISIDLPDLQGRLQILNVHIRKVKVSASVNLETTARGTPGFSGADLENVINEAALLAARNNKNAVEMADLEEARDKVRWGKERRSRVMDDHDRRVTAYHEAGHAIVGLHCEHTTPLHKVTIIPRGNAYLGAAMYLPARDKYTHTRSELCDEIAVLMGGRVAEELIFDEITTGAGMDIRVASDMARKMVTEWGMSARIGMLHLGERGDHIYLGRDIARTQDFSEATARAIDEEVSQIVQNGYHRARQILTDHRDRLEALGGALLKQETMDVQEIRALLGLPPLPPPPEAAPAVPPAVPPAPAASAAPAAPADSAPPPPVPPAVPTPPPAP